MGWNAVPDNVPDKRFGASSAQARYKWLPASNRSGLGGVVRPGTSVRPTSGCAGLLRHTRLVDPTQVQPVFRPEGPSQAGTRPFIRTHNPHIGRSTLRPVADRQHPPLSESSFSYRTGSPAQFRLMVRRSWCPLFSDGACTGNSVSLSTIAFDGSQHGTGGSADDQV
jgi:hypothetical protein